MLDKTVVKGEDLAFGIQFTMSFPENRQLTFTTAYPQNCEDGEMKKLLRRMSEAADYLDSVYRVRALKKHLERQEFELATCRQQAANQLVKFKTEWEVSNRKGPFKLSGAQKGTVGNLESTEKRYVEDIKKLREEIADLEKLQKE
jgi:hypothetical protein